LNKKTTAGIMVTMILFFGLAPAMIAESDEIEYIDVDLAYLAQHIEDFFMMSVRTNGTSGLFISVLWTPDHTDGVVVDVGPVLPFPPMDSVVIVEGWVYWTHDVECSFYLVYADSWVVIPATIDIDLDMLNLKSIHQWLTCYIELPEGYNVSDIDVSSIRLNNTISVDFDAPTFIGDYDNDTIPDLMVKFNRTEVSEYIEYVQDILYGNVTLTVSIELFDETQFEGADTLFVLLPGDGDNDGDVDRYDFGLFSPVYGASVGDVAYNWFADFNDDENIDRYVFGILAEYYGKTAV